MTLIVHETVLFDASRLRAFTIHRTYIVTLQASHLTVHIRIVTRQQPPKTIKQQSTNSLAHQHTVKLQPSASPPLPHWI